MQKLISLIILLTFVAAGCKQSTEPQQPTQKKPPGYQEDVPWPSLADTPWPMNQGDPQNTGRTSVIGPISPNIIWTFDVDYGLLNGPVIDDKSNLYFGNDAHLADYFYCLSTDSQKIVWTFKNNHNERIAGGTLLNNQNQIIVNSNNFVYSIDKNGSLIWEWQAPEGLWLSSINIAKNGYIYIIGGFNGNILHILSDKGELKKNVEFNNELIRGITFSSTGENIYMADKESLYCLDLNGTIIWSKDIPNIISQPIVDSSGNIFIIQTNGPSSVISLSKDGQIKWEYIYSKKSDYYYPTVVVNSTLDKLGNFTFVGVDSSTSALAIISINYLGKERWIYDLESDIWLNVKLVSDADGKIYFGDTFGKYYYCLGLEGNLIWKLPLDGLEIDGAPAFDKDGTLYIGGHRDGDFPEKKTILAIR